MSVWRGVREHLGTVARGAERHSGVDGEKTQPNTVRLQPPMNAHLFTWHWFTVPSNIAPG